MKKLLLITILIFMFSMNLAYGAETYTDIKEDSCKDAVTVLSSYNIINGYPDNTFKPDMPVTRAEMAKIITIAAGYYEYSKNMTSVYDDMNGHWAERYVELADVLNIVSGITNNKYGPDNYIKFNEATTMIVRLLGYTDESIGGDWPENYYEKAIQLNLFQNLQRKNHDLATRRDISIMLYNALGCDLVSVKNNTTISNTGKKLISLIGSVSTKDVTLQDLKLESFDYTDYLFNTWDFYYDLNGKVVSVSNSTYTELTGTVTNLLSNRVIFVTDDYGNVRAIKIPDVPIVVNGGLGSYDSLLNSKIKIVSENDSLDSKILGVIAYKETDEILIDKNNLYKTGSNLLSGKHLPLKNDGQINYTKLHIYGDASSLSEIKTNDLVYFYETDESANNSALTVEVLRNQVSGFVTNTQKQDNTYYYTINNTVYKTKSNFIFTEAASVKDNVTLILDKNGDIVKLYINSYGTTPKTYGIVLSANSGTNVYATVKILDQYGNIKTYSLADNSSVVNIYDNGYSLQRINSLRKNDIIMFDPVSSGLLKIIKEMPTNYLASSYDENNQSLSNGSKLTSSTFIVYESSGRYQLLNPNKLSSYLIGKSVASYGQVNAVYLTYGLKVNETITVTEPLKETESSYSGTVLGIISSIKKLDSNISQVKFFNNYNTFYVSNSINISSMQNSYVKATITNGSITSVQKLIPETDRIKITQVYSNQLQIDGITYMEYSSNVKVYECSMDSNGNITSVKISSKYNIQPGSTAQLYDLYGAFDGVVDVILIFN